MPLIPNYFSRFRTHSQSTAATSSTLSTSIPGPSTPSTEPARLVADPPDLVNTVTDLASQAQISQKIHPDPNSLVVRDDKDRDAQVIGPLPPQGGRRRNAAQPMRPTPEAVPETSEPDESVKRNEENKSRTSDISASPRPFFSRILSGVLSTPTSPENRGSESETDMFGSHWSTFGRRRHPASPVGEFGSVRRRGSSSKSSAKSKTSARRSRRSSVPATPSSTTHAPSHVQTAASAVDSPQSQPVSLSSSSGSKAYSSHSRRHRPGYHEQSFMDPRTPPHDPTSFPFTSPIPEIVSPEFMQSHLDGSPNTFGRSTPRRPGTTSRAHLDLSSAFTPPRTSTPPPPERLRREPPATYPPKSRKRSQELGSSVSFPSLPFRTSARPDRTRAEDVFLNRGHDRKSSSLSAHLGLGSFLGVDKDDTERRKSADWSKAEALKPQSAGAEETWPMSVSRQVVMMSLTSHTSEHSALPTPPGSTGAPEAEENGALRDIGAKNPTLFGSIGEERRLLFQGGARRKKISAPPAITSSTPEPSSSISSRNGASLSALSSKLIPEVSVTVPTPSPSPNTSHMKTLSDPGPSLAGNSNVAKSHGKRKQLESEEEVPPTDIGTRPILISRRNSNRPSDVSHAPSSFRQSKRIRLSTPASDDLLSRSQAPSLHSPPGSPTSRPPSSLRTLPNSRSLSQTSIPIRAIVSPRPPSIDRHSTYHMRDPALPLSRRQSTQWTGGARKLDEVGHERRVFPLQGWAFIVGFILFPLWWVAAVAPVGWGWGRAWGKRRAGMQDGKGDILTDEEVAAREVIEYDVAYTWRRRCRLMSLLGLVVYIPLITLVAFFVPRA